LLLLLGLSWVHGHGYSDNPLCVYRYSCRLLNGKPTATKKESLSSKPTAEPMWQCENIIDNAGREMLCKQKQLEDDDYYFYCKCLFVLCLFSVCMFVCIGVWSIYEYEKNNTKVAKFMGIDKVF
jgi:hypothetical protein